MNQRPRTIQEQLTRLKEKGMEFNDEQIAISYLARISYFRLKYYWVDMLDNNTGHFVNGTSFNTIIDRYEFDKKLRNILLEQLKSWRWDYVQNSSQLFRWQQIQDYGIWIIPFLKTSSFTQTWCWI